MKQLLPYKRDIFLVFLIGLSLSIMSIYQTYAYDIEKEAINTKRPSPDLKYTFNLLDSNDSTYTINLEPGETKLLDLTINNKNNYNVKYALYTTTELEKNTVLAIIDTSSSNAMGIIKKNSSNTISLIAVNRKSTPISYDISYLTGYEKGGDLTNNNFNLITDIYSFPNTPYLDDNMIPVMYDEETAKWVTADITNTNPNYYWYDYFLGRWANIVTITPNSILDLSNHSNNGINNNTTISNGIATFKNTTINCGLANYNFNKSISISLKIKFDNLDKNQTLISNLNNGGISIAVTDNNTITLSLYSDKQDTTYTYNTSTKIDTNKWYTITLTYNGKELNLYLNDQIIPLSGTEMITGNIKPSTNNIILGSDTFTGEIDDVLIFNQAINKEDITTYLLNTNSSNIINNLNDKGLILYYSFQQGKDIEPGTIIEDKSNLKITSFYTWIPRYKYKIWNIEKQSGMNDNNYNPYTSGIDILFEKDTNTTGTITCTNNNLNIVNNFTLSETCIGENGEYYTHPAFKFGKTKLTGIWISKYELTLNNNNIIIKNNQKINTTDTDITNMWNLVHNMTTTNNIYNFTDKLDSHLIKNIEWGALAYLSHSRYGLCQNGNCNQIGINNYNLNQEHQTGCGSTSKDSTNNCHNYNTEEGVLASTTRNTYGIYDLAGGTQEYVMGYINNKEPWANLDSKYYDSYSTTNNNILYSQESYNRSILGDAIGEISLNNNNKYNGWYDSILELTNNPNNIFVRGGNISSNSTQFTLESTNINANNNIGYRSVLTQK